MHVARCSALVAILVVAAHCGWLGPLQAAPDVFSDFRSQHPGAVHHIRAADLPLPDQAAPAVNPPQRGQPGPLQTLPGFQVQRYATGLRGARALHTAPDGDVFLAESNGGDVRVFRGLDAHGRAEKSEVFVSGLPRVYGMAFYPPGANPQWLYLSTPGDVYRIPYHSGDLVGSGAPQRIIQLPCNDRGHWTRDLAFAADGKRLFVAVGSLSNDSDPDVEHNERTRASILSYNPDGTDMRVYVSGVRNSGAGLAVHPVSGELWGSVNERDGLGDNLVPDYVTHFEENGFYGWPYFYIGNHADPRHLGKHPELASRVLVPDVLIQPHNAPLQLAFYQGTQFPAEYRGDIFVAQHGSWNRSVRTGYELVRIPMHGKTRAGGEFEDFLTGFATPDGKVWGRPVGVTVAADGALLVSDDMSNSIWRISWVGKH